MPPRARGYCSNCTAVLDRISPALVNIIPQTGISMSAVAGFKYDSPVMDTGIWFLLGEKWE